MYKIFSGVSFLVRAYLCYITIDTIPILANPIQNQLLLETISLYSILWLISYLIVGIFYDKGDNPILGIVLYFVVYIIFLGIVYLLMLFLTFVGVLPIYI